jgi:lipopolysaccharide transport system ATP-binding protein
LGRIASLLEVGTGFHPELTGRENIFLNGAILGMSRGEIRQKFDEIVAFAEVEKFLDTPVKHYSSGMYVRLAFAVAAHLEPEILIVDEVLAVGDAQFQKKCLGKMQDISNRQGRTVLFVSHNLGALANLCKRGLVFEKGHLISNLPIEKAIESYFETLSEGLPGKKTRSAHVLYEIEAADSNGIAVTKVELLDREGAPKPILSTWDTAIFRIWYRSDRKIPEGAVELQINSLYNTRLCVLSSQPDSNFRMALVPGVHFIDCLMEGIQLSSGEYSFDVGLSVPNVQWLWQQRNMGSFTVYPKDVYESGKAPNSDRSLFAPVHTWSAGSP